MPNVSIRMRNVSRMPPSTANTQRTLFEFDIYVGKQQGLSAPIQPVQFCCYSDFPGVSNAVADGYAQAKAFADAYVRECGEK